MPPARQTVEARKLSEKPIENIEVVPSSDNTQEWIAHIVGPATYVPPGATEARPSPYAGRKFAVKVTFPATYPFKHPELRFRESVMWHPLVNFEEGTLCVNNIAAFWGPTKMCSDLLKHLRDNLAAPTAEDAINAECMSQLRESIEAFEKKAAQMAAKEPLA